LTATGARIRKPEAGATNSLEQLALTLKERAARSDRTYDDFFPSMHLSYSVTENLQARAAYAQTYGRPNFTFIIPNTVINESNDAEGNVIGGTLTTRNPALLPWTADNYDVSLEYYTEHGGVFGAGVFRKDVQGFFAQSTADATPGELELVGLDPTDPGWRVNTWRNGGAARVNGMEISMNQSLKPLDRWMGGWGQYFRVFANMTKLKFKGSTTDFTGFIPTAANWGGQFRRKRVGASLRWNYRSETYNGAATGIGLNGHTYSKARTHLDVNVSYNLSPQFNIFLNVRNIMNVQSESRRRSDELASYAEVLNYTSVGVPFNIGISGSF
jgi:TonB-dependent receptor